jgi:hypothetical protein
MGAEPTAERRATLQSDGFRMVEEPTAERRATLQTDSYRMGEEPTAERRATLHIMQPAFYRSTRRRLLALWQRGMTLIVCVSLLHLPVPVLHRHDEIESAGVLASHLATCHAQTHIRSLGDVKVKIRCECPSVHESHWHFVLPSQRGDGNEPEHGIPHVETEFVAVAGSSINSNTVTDDRLFEYVGSSVPACGCHLGKLDHSYNQWHPCECAAAATQVYRCELSCVMRC